MELPKLKKPTRWKEKCPFCGKLFWSHGLNNHITKQNFKEQDYNLTIKHRIK
jgi:hypothetical protein